MFRDETFAADAERLFARLGVTGELPHLQKGVRGAWADYYDAATTDRVARLYRDDIEAFGYRPPWLS